MKKAFLLISAGCFLIPAFGQSLKTSLVSSQENGDPDSNYRNIVIEISRNSDDNDILVKASNLLGNKNTKSNTSQLLLTNFSSELKGGTLLLKYHSDINPTFADNTTDYISLLCNVENCYKVEDVDNEITGIKFVYDDNMIGLGLNYYPISLYHAGDLKKGEAITLTPAENQNSQLVSTIKEWVIYNPSDSDGKPRIFRLRFHDGEFSPTMDHYYRYLWLYEGTEFDASKATKIARVSDEGNNQCIPENVTVPASFWGTGFKSTPKLSDWCSSQNVHYVPYCINGRDSEFDVYNSAFGVLHGYAISDDPIIVNGKHEGHIIVTETGYKADENLPWKGEWITGIGAVGDTYASNPIYPIYELPEGVTPAYLLYVRNIANNTIIYGDSALDPDFALLKAEPGLLGIENIIGEPKSISWNITGDTLSVYAEGEINLTIYSPDGRIVNSLAGYGTINADLPALSGGAYIIRAITSEGISTRKVIR